MSKASRGKGIIAYRQGNKSTLLCQMESVLAVTGASTAYRNDAASLAAQITCNHARKQGPKLALDLRNGHRDLRNGHRDYWPTASVSKYFTKARMPPRACPQSKFSFGA
jgi:hypothetical protein